MPPAAVYPVIFNGITLPGYAQQEDLPLFMKMASSEILGRDGGTQARQGGAMRDVAVTMRVLSSLSTGTGMQHLADCYAQWESAMNTCVDAPTPAQLKIGRTDRYLNAEFISSTAPQTADSTSRRLSYTLTFKANPPYFLGTAVNGSATVGGNTTITTTIGDTRRTYPTITIPSAITRITLSGVGTGKAFTLSGSHASSWVVNCATLQITQAGSNSITNLTSSPDFGISRTGAGSLVLSSSNVIGSATVSVTMQPRFTR